MKHPISAAVCRHLTTIQDLSGHSTRDLITNIQVVPSKGVQGKYNNLLLRAGSASWLSLTHHEAVVAIEKSDPHLSVFCVEHDSTPIAIFGLTNPLRPNALQVVRTLQTKGIKVHIVSGDNTPAVEAVAAQLGISKANVRARCTPEDKYNYIRRIQQYYPSAVVLFCGDGTNDAPALKCAHVGVHMASNSGTDVAGAAASVVLVRPDLRALLVAIDISKAAFARIFFNFTWSAVYNLLALSMAAGAWVAFRIPPAYAAFGEMVSIVPVFIAAWSLKLSRFGNIKEA